MNFAVELDEVSKNGQCALDPLNLNHRKCG